MGKFLTDRWNDIVSLNSAQWFVVLLLAVAIGTGLFYFFNWFYSQRFTAAKDLIDIQKRHLEVYAGKPPTLPTENVPPPANPILPPDWSPYLDQAIDFLDAELQDWKRGQQGANRMSADLGWIHDAKLLELYVRLYERLPHQQRDALRAEQAAWLTQRSERAKNAVESHGGSLAPLEYNIEFIEATKQRIAELETQLKPFEQPATA
jgi:uncharacterized protein YecT (DUF1311 family)